MSDEQKVPDRNHALNVIAADLSDLYGWLKLSTRYAAAHEALAVVERDLGLPVGDDLFPRRGPQLAPQPTPTVAPGEDTAAVLRELLDKIEEMQYTDWAINCDGPLFKRARAALKATTGARAVSSRPKCATCGHYPDRDPEPGVCEACECPNHAGAGTAGGESSDEVIERAARVAMDGFYRQATPKHLAQHPVAEPWLRIAPAVLAAAPPTPAAHGVAGYVLGTCFRDTQGNAHREGWSGDWYATRAQAYEELAKWPGNEDHEAAVFEVRLAYDPHQHVWCPTCDDYPGGRCTDHTGRVCCITHGTRLVSLTPAGADGEAATLLEECARRGEPYSRVVVWGEPTSPGRADGEGT